jgi:predicted nucleotidyltransferase
MLDRKVAIEKVDNFIKEIKLSGLNIKKAILFGSFAKGNQREYSDIDVALAADEFIGFGFIDRDYFAEINIKDEYMLIETKTYPTDYFEKGDPVIRNPNPLSLPLTDSFLPLTDSSFTFEIRLINFMNDYHSHCIFFGILTPLECCV